LNSERFVCTEDVCFERVIHACATAGGRDLNGTWLIPEMQKAYTELHRRGHAHSVEVWHNARLVGGLYGLLIGRVFFGESMFHEETDASKVAVIHLVHWLKQHHGALIDCQQTTPHMLRLGAEELPRRQFVSLLKEFCPQYRFPPVQYDNGE
jgi:leucyl/phenylalanyl-tRNA--protein transferase